MSCLGPRRLLAAADQDLIRAMLATRRCRESLPQNLYQCLNFETAAAAHPSAMSEHWRGHGEAYTPMELGANQLS